MYTKVPLMGKRAERKVLLMGQHGASVVISLLAACANIGRGAECKAPLMGKHAERKVQFIINGASLVVALQYVPILVVVQNAKFF